MQTCHYKNRYNGKTYQYSHRYNDDEVVEQLTHRIDMGQSSEYKQILGGLSLALVANVQFSLFCTFIRHVTT